MAEVRARLERCFASVFPDLRPEEIEDASPEAVEAWDSLANATLITVVEEEFELEFSPDELSELVSFDSLAAYLERRGCLRLGRCAGPARFRGGRGRRHRRA